MDDPPSPSPSDREPDADPVAVQAALPQGLAIISADGVIRTANEQVLRMLGMPREQVVGRSVLDFVHPDDLAFAVDILSDGERFAGMVTGPVRARYLDGNGVIRTTDLWSRTCLDVPGIEGFVVTMAEEATAEMLSDAVRALAAGAPVDDVLHLVVRALGGHPVQARATLLLRREHGVVPVGPWPLGSTGMVAGDGSGARRGATTPWDAVLSHGATVEVDAVELDEELHAAATAGGVAAVWCRPVRTGDGAIAGALVVWRARPGRPSVNQDRHLDDATDVAALALDQQAYRASMERAAFVDPVSGLGNRARFEQILDAGDERGVAVDAVLYVDLDDFKRVNDRHGHAAGDQVLAHAASRLRGAVRSHDEVVRVGGDEFVVLCHPPGSPDGVDSLAERVCGVLAAPYALDGAGPIVVGASVGVETAGRGLPLRVRVGLADRAMYAAKAAGGGRWHRATAVTP